MTEFEKIARIIATANVHAEEKPLHWGSEKNLCLSVRLVGESLLSTCESYRENNKISVLSEYIEGELHGKLFGFNQLSILLSCFFPDIKPETVEFAALLKELAPEEGDEL